MTNLPSIDSLGRWPVEGKKARQAKKIIPIRAEEQLPLIHGKEKHVLFSDAQDTHIRRIAA